MPTNSSVKGLFFPMYRNNLDLVNQNWNWRNLRAQLVEHALDNCEVYMLLGKQVPLDGKKRMNQIEETWVI